MSHVLHGYQVSVRRKRDQKNRLLGNFDDGGADLLEQLQAFFEDPASRTWLDEEMGAAVEVGEVLAPTDERPRILAANVKAGESGVVSEFRAVQEGAVDGNVAFRRMRNHIEFLNVLLLASLPGSRTTGFLIAHSPSGRGVKTRFFETFKAWFTARFPDYLVDLSPCAPEGFFKRLAEEASLKRVTLVRDLRPSDRAEEDDGRWFDTTVLGRMTTVIAPVGRLRFLKKKEFLDALDDDEKLKSLLVLHGETYEEIRTTFRQTTGREYSIVMSSEGMRTPRAGYDVTEQVDYDENGEPTLESLFDAAVEYVEILQPSN